MREVMRNGIEPIIDSIAAHANLYIALDIDVMNPAVVPAVIGPAPGGFDYWQILDILEAAADKAIIRGFNLAELMPAADIGGRGALVAARLAAMVMGLIAGQRR
jgi:agmatinase